MFRHKRFFLKCFFVIISAICFTALAESAYDLVPWATNTDPSDVAKSTSMVITSGSQAYTIVQGGTMDGANCRTPLSWYEAMVQTWESNRTVKLENTGTTDIVNPWLSNGRNNFRTGQEIVDSAVTPGMTLKEKVLAITWQQNRHRYHEGIDNEASDPVKVLNVYGYGLCELESRAWASLCKVAGVTQVTPVHAMGHCFPQAYFDGRWNILDSEYQAIMLLRDNETIASEQDCGRDHDLVKRTHVAGILSPDSSNIQEGTYAPMFVYEGPPAGDIGVPITTTMNMTLRPNEAITWRWGHLSPSKFHDENNTIRETHMICDGLWEYNPDFAINDTTWRSGALSVSNITNTAGTLTATSGTGAIVWKITSPYVIVGGSIAPAGTGAVFSISWDNSSWTTLSSNNLDSNFPHTGTPRYSYYLRCQLTGSNNLTGLNILNDIQMAPLALPEMRVGSNPFTYSDQSTSRNARITHEWVERSASNPPNAPPSCTYPADAGESDGTDIIFKWTVPTDPDAGDTIADYQYELSDRADMKWPLSFDFYKIISKTKDTGKAQLSLPYPGLLAPDKTYYWHVKAKDSHGVWGAWSNTWSFTARGVNYPINIVMDTTTVAGIGTLKWSANLLGRAPAKYRVYGSDEKGFTVSDSTHVVFVGETTEFGVPTGWKQAIFPSNFVTETTATQLDVVGPGLALPNTNKAYYRVVAVDSVNKRSWSSDFAQTPSPFIYSQPVLVGQIGQPYSYQVNTIRSIGDLKYNSNLSRNFRVIERPKYTLTQAPSGLSINQDTGLISGTPASLGTVIVSVVLQSEIRDYDLRWLAWGIERSTVTPINIGPFTQQYLLGDINDTTPPSNVPAVRDGTGSDASATFSTTTLSANWDSSADAESGISGYKYAIGTAQGATDIAVWTTISNVTSVTRTGLSLSAGTTYYFSVAAINGAGLQSAATTYSNGQYVAPDATPPSAPGIVRDGATAGVDISTTISTTQLNATWTSSADAESGISGYKYAIGTTAGGFDTTNWTTIGNVLTITKTSLSLSVGSTYYFSVKAVNGQGLTGTATNSNGVLVVSTADASAPTAPPAVRDGAVMGTDDSSTISATTLSANWAAASDPESGITNYQYAIGTTAGGIDVATWTTIGNVLTITRSALTLTPGSTYYFSVKAINGGGLTGPAANSNGQYVIAIDTSDTSAPANIGVVRDGLSSDVDSSTSLTQLSANWEASADAESGILRYWYSIGTSAGALDTRNWTDNGQAISVNATGLSLSAGATYYFSVKVENGVGLFSQATNSNGQYIAAIPLTDTTPPVISVITAQNITQAEAVITWTTDEPATSLVEYGSSANYNKTTTLDSTYVTAHSMALPNLTANTVYHYRVISRDTFGNETASVDYTFTTLPPAPTQINPEIHAYPNPYRIGNNPVKFRMAGMTGGEVGIYTISGRLIKKQTGTTEISWDGTNTDGEKVGRGIYIYKITSSTGETITGKLALTK